MGDREWENGRMGFGSPPLSPIPYLPFSHLGGGALRGSDSFEVKEFNVDFSVKDKLLNEYAEIGYEFVAGEPKTRAIKINGEEIMLDSSGPIVVYFSELRRQDIIHRAVLKLNASDGSFLVTLGDNNSRLDQDCVEQSGAYNCITINPVPLEKIKGTYLFHIPLVGYVKLLLFDDLPKLVFG